MSPLMTCPDEEKLRCYVLGELAESQSVEIDEHLQQCTSCCDTVAQLDLHDTISDALQTPLQEVVQESSDVVNALIDRLTDLPVAEYVKLLAPAQFPDELGRLGRYRVLKPIGHGGMGAVFDAEDPQLKRRVALKIIQPALTDTEIAKERFLKEARAMAAIRNEHVVTIFDVGEESGVPFFTMEFLQGETLRDCLRRQQRLPVVEALHIARQVAQGLSAAHSTGLLHRDIKPANIWLESPPACEVVSSPTETKSKFETPSYPVTHVKLVDFGLARSLTTSESEGASERPDQLTETGTILGTPEYMAPEQARGASVDQRCDLFSLGVVLYEMLTGRRPFQAKTPIGIVVAAAVEPATPPSTLNANIPVAVSNLILKLLSKSPDDRYQTASEVARALGTLIEKTAAGTDDRVGKSDHAVLSDPTAESEPPFEQEHISRAKLERLRKNAPAEHATRTHDQPRFPRRRNRKPPLWTTAVIIAVLTFAAVVIYTSTRRSRIPRHFTEELRPEPIPGSVPTASADELDSITRVIAAGVSGDPDDPKNLSLRTRLVQYRANHLGTTQAIRAAELMRQLPWPVDTLQRDNIPLYELKAAGGGDPGEVPKELVAIIGDSRLRNPGSVTQLGFTSDGTKLISAGGHKLLLWSVETGELLGHDARSVPGSRFAFALRADERQIAVAAGNWDLMFLEFPSLGVKHVVKIQTAQGFHSMTRLPETRKFVTGSGDGFLRIWDFDTFKMLKEWSAHKSRINAITCSHNGVWLASGSADKTVKLWNVQTGELVETLKGHTDAVLCLLFSKDDRFLYSGGRDAMLRIWSTDTWQETKTLKQNQPIEAMALNPEGTQLASDADPEVAVWNTTNWKVVLSVRPVPGIRALAFSPDGTVLATGNLAGRIQLWDVERGKERLSEFPESIVASEFSSDGQYLLTARNDSVAVWNIATNEFQERSPISEPIGYVAAASPAGIVVKRDNSMNATRVWEPLVRQSFLNISDPKWNLYHCYICLALSGNGQFLAGGDSVGNVQVFDLGQKRLRHEWSAAHSAAVTCLAFRPDGGTLASGSYDGLIKLWDIKTGQVLGQIQQKHSLRSLAFTPDGKDLVSGAAQIVVSGADKNCLRVWDVSTVEEAMRLPVNGVGYQTAVAVSSDNRLIATARDGDTTLFLFDRHTGELRRRIHMFPIIPPRKLFFSPDSRHVAMLNGTGTVYVFRLQEYQPSQN